MLKEIFYIIYQILIYIIWPIVFLIISLISFRYIILLTSLTGLSLLLLIKDEI